MVSRAVLLHPVLNHFVIAVELCLKIRVVREPCTVCWVVIIFESQLCLMVEVAGLGLLVAEIWEAKVAAAAVAVAVKVLMEVVEGVNGPYSPGKDCLLTYQFESEFQ